MRAAILARVSTDGQEVASQLAQLRVQAVRDGVVVVAEYVDDGISGASASFGARAGLHQMLADAAREPREWTILYVWDFDRFLRSDEPEQQAAIIGPLKRARTIVRDRNGEVPPLWTTVGRLIALLRLDGAADWLQKHKDQIKRGKDAAIAAGKKPAGPTPFGYLYDRDEGLWSIDEPAAAVVREIYRRVAAGESCGTIARDLDLRGIKRPRAGRWSRERVWAIVTARTYMGSWLADKRRKLSVPVPVIVEPEAWHAAEAVLVGLGHRGLPRSSRCALLESLCRCSICKSPVLIMSRARGMPSYYVCKSRIGKTRSGGGCTLPWRQVPEVDAEVWADVVELLAHPDQLAAALADGQRAAEAGGHDWAKDAADYERQLEVMEARQRALVERYSEGAIEEGDLDEVLRRNKGKRALLRQSLDVARAQLARATLASEQIDAALGTLATLGARLEDATPEVRREIVLLLVPVRRSLEMSPTAVTGDLLVPTDGHGGAVWAPDRDSTSCIASPYDRPRLPLRVMLR